MVLLYCWGEGLIHVEVGDLEKSMVKWHAIQEGVIVICMGWCEGPIVAYVQGTADTGLLHVVSDVNILAE